MIYNINETTWEIIKAVKKHGLNNAVNSLSGLFKISKKEAKEDIEIVLKNLKNLGINIEDIPLKEPREIYAPRIVHFDVTSNCNSNCIYCLSSDRMKKQKDLSTKKIMDVLKELSSLGTWILTISGGEPLLRDDIFKILDYAKEKEISIRLFTNGILIDDLTAKKLSKYKDTMIIQVSLDSNNPKHHDIQRGMKGSYLKTVNGIKNLIKHDIKTVVSSVITPITLQDVEATADFIHKLGIGYLRIGNANLYSNKAKYNKDKIELDEKQVKVLGEKIKKLAETYKSSMKFSLSPNAINYNNSEGPYDVASCTAGVVSLYITSLGEVYPCIALCYPELKAGDIHKDPLIKIWNNAPIFKKLRNLSFEDFEKCKSCSMRDTCRGGCRGNSYEYFKSLKSYDPIHCLYFNK